MPPDGPLNGIRIVALEQFGAGPFGTRFLADLGADVVKVEHPAAGGDVGRYVPPYIENGSSLYFETFNRNKSSIVVDLKNPLGRAVFEKLVARSDVVFNNLRADLTDSLRLDYDNLGPLNPALVCVSLSGYGSSGGNRPGYDALIQAEAGWASMTGDPNGPPVRSGLSLADYVGGLISALGILAAVLQARETGRGADVRTNLYDCALSMLGYQATWQMSRGLVTERYPNSAHPSIVPFQFFATSDGHIAVACAKERFFTSLVHAMGLGHLSSDERFLDFEARRQNASELLSTLQDRFRTRTTTHWIELLSDSVPISRVRGMNEALDPEEVSDRGLLVEYDHPVLGEVRTIGLPLELGTFRPMYRRGPLLGEDTVRMLDELGYTPDQQEALAQSGALGERSEVRRERPA